ncbi:MAG: MBL fold metallo-hydrolase [Lachnospiraceae bacterium]|jgi:hydroxyacylglutathione hydrolase|nr:MBL fold metallo-hydrolase [Lachnospiraceae bacterium]
MDRMQIERRVLGMVRTNCYLVVNRETMEAVIIDPADSAGVLIADLDALGARPAGILLTHGHFDHIGAARELSDRYQIPICAGREEADIMEDAGMNLSIQFGNPISVKADRLLEDGETLSMAGFDFRVLFTPGHTKGGVCYYVAEEQALFSGDTLFCESVGRSDFPTGSMSVLVHSVQGLLQELPEETAVYPGHEGETSIAHEKRNNPYIF